jgi:hypothetical protein
MLDRISTEVGLRRRLRERPVVLVVAEESVEGLVPSEDARSDGMTGFQPFLRGGTMPSGGRAAGRGCERTRQTRQPITSRGQDVLISVK